MAAPLDGAHPYLDRVHPEDLESLIALIDLASLSDAHAIVRVSAGGGRWTLVEHRARLEADAVVLERVDVTVREQERAHAGRTDAYWRTILRNGREAIAVLDPESHRIRHASDHLVELIDVDPAELAWCPLASLVHMSDRHRFHDCVRRLDIEDRVVTEFRLGAAGQPSRWVEAVLSDARDDPDVAAIVVNLRDIEDRKRAEQQLRSSEHLFRVLLGHLADGALVLDPNGAVRFASERAAEILHVRVDDLVGRRAPLGRRDDGVVVLSSDAELLPADVDRLPAEVAGPNDRWYELFTHDLGDDPVVDGLVLVFRDITDRRRDVERLRHELELDGLTGLTNRRGFEAKVRARVESGEHLHLAFLDLNGFKAVNDTYGHGAGDELLRRVAERLTLAIRGDDIVARLGGDEFVVAAAMGNPVLRDELADRLAFAVGGAYQLGPDTVHLTVSAGWSEVGGGTDLDEALRLADHRMYAEKRRVSGLSERTTG